MEQQKLGAAVASHGARRIRGVGIPAHLLCSPAQLLACVGAVPQADAGSYGTQRRADVEQLIGAEIDKQLGVGQGAVLARGCMQSNTAQAQIEWTLIDGDALSKSKFDDMLRARQTQVSVPGCEAPLIVSILPQPHRLTSFRYNHVVVHLIHSGMVITMAGYWDRVLWAFGYNRPGGPRAKVLSESYAEDPMRPGQPSGHLQAVIQCEDNDTTLELLPTSAQVGPDTIHIHVHTRDPLRRLAPARIARTYPAAQPRAGALPARVRMARGPGCGHQAHSGQLCQQGPS
jgi:hypothetical protein